MGLLKRAYAWLSDDVHQHIVLGLMWITLGSWVTFGPLNWKDALPWVAFMSLYANVVGHWSGYEAAKAQRTATSRGYNG